MTTTTHHHVADIASLFGVSVLASVDAPGWAENRDALGLAPGADGPPEDPTLGGKSQGLTSQPGHAYQGGPVVLVHVEVAAHAALPDLVRTIAHEAHHVAQAVLERVGESETEEVHAYLAGYVAQTLTELALDSGWTPAVDA